MSTSYFANYGTLLGAIRDGQPVPWDDDVDLLIKGPFDASELLALFDSSEYATCVKVRPLTAATRQRFQLTDSAVSAKKISLRVWRPQHPDIALVISMPVAHRYPGTSVWAYQMLREWVEIEDAIISSTRRVPFLTGFINAPAGAEQLLDAHYGSDWLTPAMAWGPYLERLESRPGQM